MQIDVTTTTSRFAIDVLDTEFAKKWSVYMKNISQFRGKRHKVLSKDFQVSTWSPYQPNVRVTRGTIVEIIEKMETALYYCQSGIPQYDWTLAFEALGRVKHTWRSKVDIRQSDLNILHREFTTQCLLKNNISDDDPLLNKMVHDINQTVHQLETFISWDNLPLRKKYNSIVHNIIYTSANLNSDDDSLFFHRIRPQFDMFDHRAEKTDFNVWLSNDILGKDLVCCYLDDDDPTNDDITGNAFMTPNIMIDVDKHYNQILRSTEFNQWHSKHCPDKMLNRWPIGNINLDKYSLPKSLNNEKVLKYSIK